MSSNTDRLDVALSGPGCSYLRPELRDLKVIGVEEHTTFPTLSDKIPDNDTTRYVKRMFKPIFDYPHFNYALSRITELDEKRIADMDEGGIAMQVLSNAGSVNTTFADPDLGAEIARSINDELKKAVDRRPDRFVALAELPFQAPELASNELRRCVKELGFVGCMLCGSVGGTGEYLDAPRFDGLLATFEELDVPLFLHPGIVPKAVSDTYYHFPDKPTVTSLLAGPGWGWHDENAVHVLRLAVSGTLDRHPRLKIVVGHQGEMMPMMIQRFDSMFDAETMGLKRSVGEMLRSQVWIAISGMFTIPPTVMSINTWGADRVLFACDYPFIDTQRAPEFLKALGDAISPSDLKKICQTNAEELFKLRA